MGIPKLNKLLLEKCPHSIYKSHLGKFIHKKISVDISIYLYKFLSDGNYIENLYLFLSIFKYYCITPIFIFDGKPPPEKNEVIKRRYCEKKQAYNEFKKIEKEISETNDLKLIYELQQKLNYLKKKCVRVTTSDTENAIELIKAFGFQYYIAPIEADQLCVYLTTNGLTYATMSDDMDMIVFGCPIVLRNFSIMNHTVTLYDTSNILNDLQVTSKEFRDIVVLSGTDYEISNSTEKMNIWLAFDYHKKYKDSGVSDDFYEWLNKYGIVTNINDELNKISQMMNIDNYTDILNDFIKKNIIKKSNFSISTIKTIMQKYKFIFV
jgi:flap endonuclease-1